MLKYKKRESQSQRRSTGVLVNPYPFDSCYLSLGFFEDISPAQTYRTSFDSIVFFLRSFVVIYSLNESYIFFNLIFSFYVFLCLSFFLSFSLVFLFLFCILSFSFFLFLCLFSTLFPACLLSFSSDFLCLFSTFSFFLCLFLCLSSTFFLGCDSTFFFCLPSTIFSLVLYFSFRVFYYDCYCCCYC